VVRTPFYYLLCLRLGTNRILAIRIVSYLPHEQVLSAVRICWTWSGSKPCLRGWHEEHGTSCFQFATTTRRLKPPSTTEWCVGFKFLRISEYDSYCGDTVRTFPPSLLQTRNMSWTRKARVSTSAGFAARRDVFDKSDRLTEPKGSATSDTLPPDELKQVQEIWGEHDPKYGEFLKKFARRMRKRRPDEMVDNVNDWSSQKHSQAELQWQTMTSDIEVLFVLIRYDSYQTRMLAYSRCSTKSSMLETHSRPRSSKITSTQRRTTPASDTTTWMKKATRLPSTAPSFVYFGTQCMKTVRFVSPRYERIVAVRFVQLNDTIRTVTV